MENKISYKIHPAIGFARVGNSPDSFYLEPVYVGGLPLEPHDETPVKQFKEGGLVRRQAARFRVFRHEEGKDPVEVSPGCGLKATKWTVHVANKKSAWYNFSELQGDVMLGEGNTYEQQGVPLRNASFKGDRKTLITDPGPRTFSAPSDWVEFDAASAPSSYKNVSFPPAGNVPYAVTTLGKAKMTGKGELLVIGGFGNAGGPANSNIVSFAGADGWYDDIGDGPVTAEIETEDGAKHTLGAWVVSGAPKLAPELVNIASLADTFIDVGVRFMGLCPDLYDVASQTYCDTYQACWERDILPIFNAMKEYRWVANVDAMVSIASPGFDLADMSEHNRQNRQVVFSMFRDPGSGKQSPPELTPQHQQAFAENGFPLMPMNSGDNSIRNFFVEKFMALTPTQYHLLRQWANGHCVSRRHHPNAGSDWNSWANPLDIATAGNAVGEPMAPGIEVTWTMRNPSVLLDGDPFRIKARVADYSEGGLSASRDETLDTTGCEPGDLTKRMATPWQADFYDCSVQDVNFTNPKTNKTVSTASAIPLAPVFLAYWWPAQSPYNVYSGAATAAEQLLDGNALIGNNNVGQALGQNVLYHRGLNSFSDAVVGWKYLGFILNRTAGPHRDMLRFFVESERNYEAFQSGYYGIMPDGSILTTQPVTAPTSITSVNAASQNVFPIQWLIGI